MEFLDLFGGKDFAIIDLDSGVLFDPFAECGLGDAIFLTELGLGLAVLMEGDKGFFKILIIFGVVVCSHEKPPSLFIVY